MGSRSWSKSSTRRRLCVACRSVPPNESIDCCIYFEAPFRVDVGSSMNLTAIRYRSIIASTFFPADEKYPDGISCLSVTSEGNLIPLDSMSDKRRKRLFAASNVGCAVLRICLLTSTSDTPSIRCSCAVLIVWVNVDKAAFRLLLVVPGSVCFILSSSMFCEVVFLFVILPDEAFKTVLYSRLLIIPISSAFFARLRIIPPIMFVSYKKAAFWAAIVLERGVLLFVYNLNINHPKPAFRFLFGEFDCRRI